MPKTEIGLKSRRLKYFDPNTNTTRTKLFTALEISSANTVFEKVEDVLIDNDYDIINKYVSIGRCKCQSHQDTYFMINVDSDEITIDVLKDIEDILEGLEVKLIGVIARHERRRDYLELVIIQKFH
jgi:hypothetical protein